MEWIKNKNARKFPKARKYFQQEAELSPVGFPRGPVQLVNGKPCVMETHTVDFVAADEVGNKVAVASTTLREGSYIFPIAYIHSKTEMFGETKDIRFTPSIGWEIYLDAVLRDPSTSEPVLSDHGNEIDLSGWYRESDLIDAEFGVDVIRPGKMAPTPAERAAARSARARRLAALGL